MNPRLTQPAEAIVLHYPDGPHDSEALLVHPLTGNLYIITKQPFGSSHVYEATAPMSASEPVTLRHIAELKIPTMFGGMITDGAISPNGKLVALCDYLQGYELALDDGSSDFDSIWTQPLRTIALGSRRQGEAITYRLDGLALLATSEGSPAPLIQIVRR